MSKNIKLTIDALPTTSTGLGFDDNKLVVKISKTTNNGLSIVNGKLVATKFVATHSTTVSSPYAQKRIPLEAFEGD